MEKHQILPDYKQKELLDVLMNFIPEVYVFKTNAEYKFTFSIDNEGNPNGMACLENLIEPSPVHHVIAE